MNISSSAILAACVLAAACDRRAPAQAAPDLSGKNLLVALIDAASAPRMSVYGALRDTTPFLRELAKHAIVFDDVTATAPYTLASTASLFTGLLPDQHRVLVAGDVLPDAVLLLPECFAASGARTFAVSTNAHVHAQFGFGRGVERFEWIDPQVGRTAFHEVPEQLFEVLMEELTSTAPRPFFGYLHLMPPHAPYDPPAHLRARFAPQLTDNRYGGLEYLSALTVGAIEADPEQCESIRALYDAGLLYADECLRRIYASLEASGLADETLFVVLSDHGEAFGERELYQHSGHVLESMLRVPLLLRFPDEFGAGRRVPQPVSLVDVFPTLIELFDLQDTLEDEQLGAAVSLVPWLIGAQDAVHPGLLARTAGPGPYSSLRIGNEKVVYASQTNRWTMFDVESDFFELENLAGKRPRRLERMQAELAKLWLRYRPDAVERARVTLSKELIEQLRAIGYTHE